MLDGTDLIVLAGRIVRVNEILEEQVRVNMGPSEVLSEETVKVNGCVTCLHKLGVGEIIGDIALCLILASELVVVYCDTELVGIQSGDVGMAWDERGKHTRCTI